MTKYFLIISASLLSFNCSSQNKDIKTTSKDSIKIVTAEKTWERAIDYFMPFGTSKCNEYYNTNSSMKKYRCFKTIGETLEIKDSTIIDGGSTMKKLYSYTFTDKEISITVEHFEPGKKSWEERKVLYATPSVVFKLPAKGEKLNWKGVDAHKDTVSLTSEWKKIKVNDKEAEAVKISIYDKSFPDLYSVYYYVKGIGEYKFTVENKEGQVASPSESIFKKTY
jgi:hypothetical protein